MTTARDLLTITMDTFSKRPVERGDLALALAAAELTDLLRVGAARLEGERIHPADRGPARESADAAHGAGAPDDLDDLDEADEADDAEPPAPEGDGLLAGARAALRRRLPYETVEDWLWRRGRGLLDTYLDAFESEGRLTRERRRRWGLFSAGRMVLVDSPERRRAAYRWSADEPVLLAFAGAIGAGTMQDSVPEPADPAVGAVLAALAEAVAELGEERRRRARRRDEARVTTLRRGY